MNSTLNAAVASDRQHQRISEAVAYRRSHQPGLRRAHRVASFVKDHTSASR